MKAKDSFSEIISTLSESLSKMTPDEARATLDRELERAGAQGVRRERTETKNAPYCPDGNEYRTCHWVDHGDGTVSDEWCSNWGCR